MKTLARVSGSPCIDERVRKLFLKRDLPRPYAERHGFLDSLLGVRIFHVWICGLEHYLSRFVIRLSPDAAPYPENPFPVSYFLMETLYRVRRRKYSKILI